MIEGGNTKKLLVRTATGALVGSVFNRPGTGAAIGALTALGGGEVDTKKLLVRTAGGALIGSLFNRPGTGAAIGALTALGGGGKVLTYYYADWCPYCVNFKPEWKKLSKMMKEQGWTVKEWNIDSGREKMEGAGVNSIPAVVYEIGDKAPVVIKGISKMSAPEVASQISGGKVRKARKSPGILGSAEAAVSGLLSVPARLLGMKRSKSPRRIAGGQEKWTLWGGEAPVEGGEAPIAGGEIEGGKRHRRSPRRMRGGAVEGGEAKVEGGEVKVEGGEIEGGKRHRSRRMRGGEVEGGEIEGGKRYRYRMRGGEVEGGEVAVEGGDIEGGRNRVLHRRRWRSPLMLFGGEDVEVAGGEIEGGRKLSAYNLHMRKYMNEHKGEKGAFARGAAMWRARK
jgi:thiol-disulfide isomerase/thioredoxin